MSVKYLAMGLGPLPTYLVTSIKPAGYSRVLVEYLLNARG